MMTNARTAFMTASAAKIFAVSPPFDCKEERARRGTCRSTGLSGAYCLSFAVLWCRLECGGKPARASRWGLGEGLVRCRAMAHEAPAEMKFADASAILEREAGLHRNLTPRQLSMIAVGGAIGTGL